MTRRVIDWISGVLHDEPSEPPVHFHRGPHLRPLACHDAGCSRPRLDV